MFAPFTTIFMFEKFMMPLGDKKKNSILTPEFVSSTFASYIQDETHHLRNEVEKTKVEFEIIPKIIIYAFMILYK